MCHQLLQDVSPRHAVESRGFCQLSILESSFMPRWLAAFCRVSAANGRLTVQRRLGMIRPRHTDRLGIVLIGLFSV